MRSLSAYYLLLLYVTVLIKPLLPFLKDAWDHQFNEIEHVSIVHALYGSHHLEKELTAQETGTGKTTVPNTLKSEEQASYHLPVASITLQRQEEPTDLHYPLISLHNLPLIYLAPLCKPPRIISL